MKKFLNSIIKYSVGILVFLSISSYSIISAQVRTDYDTPLGKKIYVFGHYPTNTHTVYAQEWGSAATGYDGLTISAVLQLDGNSTSLTNLFDFFNQNSENYLSVYVENSTLVLRRFKPNGSVGNFPYYDYILYDQLFDSNYTTWEVRLYFTSNFIWIQTSPVVSGTDLYHYYSPLYFGVDNLFQKNNMYDFINAIDNKTRIVVNSNYKFGLVSVVIYAFQYDELRKDIQQNFCDPFNIAIADNEEDY